MNDQCMSGKILSKMSEPEPQQCQDMCERETAAKSNREIHIIPLNYGYNVKIDCHTFAIETPERLIEKLSAYIMDPNGVEKAWFDKKTI